MLLISRCFLLESTASALIKRWSAELMFHQNVLWESIRAVVWCEANGGFFFARNHSRQYIMSWIEVQSKCGWIWWLQMWAAISWMKQCEGLIGLESKNGSSWSASPSAKWRHSICAAGKKWKKWCNQKEASLFFAQISPSFVTLFSSAHSASYSSSSSSHLTSLPTSHSSVSPPLSPSAFPPSPHLRKILKPFLFKEKNYSDHVRLYLKFITNHRQTDKTKRDQHFFKLKFLLKFSSAENSE